MSLPSTMIAIGLAGYLIGLLTLAPLARRLHTSLSAARIALLHDPLTGLRNRAGLIADHHHLTRAERNLMTLLIDLDGFKAVNDNHGHQTGDELLTVVAARLGELADLYHGTAGRLGGDEFAVLIPANRRDPGHVAETIHTTLCQPATTSTLTLTISVSIGYTVASTDLRTSLRAADIAMYHAKRSGTGLTTSYRPGMTVPARRPHQRRQVRDPGVIE